MTNHELCQRLAGLRAEITQETGQELSEEQKCLLFDVCACLDFNEAQTRTVLGESITSVTGPLTLNVLAMEVA